MPKRGAIQLSVGFIVLIILSIAIFALAIVFTQKLFSASSRKVDEVGEQARQEIQRLANQGQTVAIAPTTIQGQGTVLLMITNDASIDSNKFGFKVPYDNCFSGACGAPSPIDWVSYSTKGSEDDPFEIEPYESREFLIAVNPTGNSPGTYVFDVDVRWNSIDDPVIVYQGLPTNVDALYSRLKFYVKV